MKRQSSRQPEPHTRAWLAFESNLDEILHSLKLSYHLAVMVEAQAARMKAFVDSLGTPPDLSKSGTAIKRLAKATKSIGAKVDRYLGMGSWQVVMLVTCVETYLQDVLAAAASVDPELMSTSQQTVPYADVVKAASLDALADEMRARWARAWLAKGGPAYWKSRLKKMGARGYSANLGPRLEQIWAIRHLVVHAAGVANTDFVKRHPGWVAAAGHRVRINAKALAQFVDTITAFMKATEAFLVARYPSMIVAAPQTAKGQQTTK